MRTLVGALTVSLLLMSSVISLVAANSRSPADSTPDWLSWASIAWKYFQTGIGVNAETGQVRAKLGWSYATEWDTASEIVSTIMARRIDLIGNTTFKLRIGMILNYLQNRPLGINQGVPWPYRAYNWDGSGCGIFCDYFTDGADSARLLMSLDMLRNYDPSYAAAAQTIYERAKTAYDAMSKSFGSGYYEYYYAKGFEAWGYDESASLQGFEAFKNAPTVDVYGVQIPTITTGVEPMLLTLLELNRSTVSSTFLDLAERVYEAQMARYSNAGLLTAWSEGAYFESPWYIYEEVYDSSMSQSWVIRAAGNVTNVRPLAYTKVAAGYLALYGSGGSYSANPFIIMLNGPGNIAGPNGFVEGTFEDGTQAPFGDAGYSDETNEFVLASAAYVLSSQSTSAANTTNIATRMTTETTPEMPTAALSTLLSIILIAAVACVKLAKNKRKSNL